MSEKEEKKADKIIDLLINLIVFNDELFIKLTRFLNSKKFKKQDITFLKESLKKNGYALEYVEQKIQRKMVERNSKKNGSVIKNE